MSGAATNSLTTGDVETIIADYLEANPQSPQSDQSGALLQPIIQKYLGEAAESDAYGSVADSTVSG